MILQKSSLAVALASLLVAAGQASAQTCTTDKDCPQGHACTISTVDPEEPVCKPSPDGRPCAQPDASPPKATVVMYCAPKTCATDTDCGTGMVCYAEKQTACSGGTAVACPRDMPCDAAPPKEPECMTTINRICAFRWQLPCNSATDCGAGFTCKPTEIGTCSGSAPGTGGGSSGSGGGSTGAPAPGFPVAARDGGASDPPAPPPMCTTMTSYPGWCSPTATSCTTDADCPALWKCSDAYDTPVSSGEARPGIVAPPPADAGPAKKQCVPTIGGVPVPARGGDSKGGSTTAPGGGGTGPSTGEVAPPGKPPQAAGADAGASAATSSKSSGCSMGAGEGGAGLTLLGLLGLVLARRRRRSGI